MSRIISLTKIIATICLLAIAPVAQASRPVAADPNWIFHSSFDNMPRKIIDTPDAVYFFVHQRYYNTTMYNAYFSVPTGAIFKLDKNNTGAGLQDLHKTIPFSGTDMRFFDVDPETGLMVIAYTDGGIDLITRDGKVTYISDIKNRTFPGSWVINSISFDPTSHNVWIGTGAGFIHISSSTLAPVQSPEWDEAVSDICPVGQKVIAIIGNTICEAPAGTNIARRESYTPIAGVTTAVPSRLMPLSANHFAYLTTNGSIQLATLANGKWTRKQLLAATSTMLQAANSSVADRLEHAVGRTANGYYISGLRTAYLISRPADDSAAPVYTKVTLPTDATLYSASYNTTDYWYYRDRGQFVNLRAATASTWSAPTAIYQTAAPLSCKDMTFVYSPVAGFIAVNNDTDQRSGDGSEKFPTLPAAYRNGKWVNLSPVYNTPYLIEEHPEYAATYKSLLNRFPQRDPRGFCIDPLFPEIAHMGSTWYGLTAINLLDPKKYPIMNVTPGDNLAKLPARTEIPKSTWGTNTSLSCAGFDADNILWMIRSNAVSPDYAQKTNYTLFYWTPEARRETLLNSDPALGDKWKTIELKSNLCGEFWIWSQALVHPSNRNKLAFAVHGSLSDGSGRPVFIFDHNGTLDDTSDDKLVRFSKYIMPDGEICGMGYMNDLIEDPNTGDIVACTYGGTFIFNPNTPLVNGYMPAEMISVESDFGSGYDFLSPFAASTACFDEYGRLWIAGNAGGVIGMSRDRKEVIAHFTTANSPLPSNYIYGIGWNPETKSLFISTDMGIAEVLVDNKLYNVSAGPQSPFLTPTQVAPDYSGTIAIHSLPAGVSLKVTDKNGLTVTTLPTPEHGVTYWNLLDNAGNRVPTGKYTVTDATGTFSVTPMTVVVTQ